MLQIRNITKHFGGVTAVADCSFEVKTGSVTALIGPNGSGKSTVFNCISGIHVPDRGKIILDNTRIEGLAVDTVSNLGVSRVFQRSHLFENLTVRENLLLSFDNEDQRLWKNIAGFKVKEQHKEKRIISILENTEMLSTIDLLTRDLSFGQKRLVELARAILNPHKLLILDEPVAGVNPKIRNHVATILSDLKARGATILLIEHDMTFTLNISDFVTVMDAGRVIACGSPQEIRANERVLEAYLGNNNNVVHHAQTH